MVRMNFGCRFRAVKISAWGTCCPTSHVRLMIFPYFGKCLLLSRPILSVGSGGALHPSFTNGSCNFKFPSLRLRRVQLFLICRNYFVRCTSATTARETFLLRSHAAPGLEGQECATYGRLIFGFHGCSEHEDEKANFARRRKGYVPIFTTSSKLQDSGLKISGRISCQLARQYSDIPLDVLGSWDSRSVSKTRVRER